MPIYLRNKDMLLEIHRSKTTFCEYDDAVRDCDYSHIFNTLGDLHDANIQELEGKVVRVMESGHVPKMTINFPAFKHYRISNHHAVEVGRSHSKSGAFSMDHGKLTDSLVEMIMMIVERIGGRGNWRNYSYNDEMRGEAMLRLYVGCLKFNEAKSDNPFAFYTAIVNNAFNGVLKKEKKAQRIRDDLFEINGMTPSIARQIDNDLKKG